MSEKYAAELQECERDGYVFIPHLLDKQETELFFGAAKADTRLMGSAFDAADRQGARAG